MEYSSISVTKMDNRFNNSYTFYHSSDCSTFERKKREDKAGRRRGIVRVIFCVSYLIYISFVINIKHLLFRAQENEQPEPEITSRGVRKRRSGFTPQERNSSNFKDTVKKEDCDYTNHVCEKQTISGGLWTDNDILELIKYVKKYPGGTPERWEKIASVMNRTVAEVTHMAKKVIILLY